MIKFSNVSLLYPHSTTTVIEDVSFEIAEGEMVLVIGPTGTGKSSLLRLINGLVPHHTGGILAGDISVDGTSTSMVKPGDLAHLIGIVGQNPINGFVADTVEEELAFGMESLNFPHDLMRKRIEETLDLLGLTQLRSRSIATLSGGEQQRVAIGTALVMHPKVLVLDEPTSALDPIAAEEVLSILHRLVHDLSITVVIAEHRLERVIGFVDRIISIDGTGATSIGSPSEILAESSLAPPIVRLSQKLGLSNIGTSVREVRRATAHIRALSPLPVKPASAIGALQVEIAGLSHFYGDKSALNKISLKLYAGQITALMGRNGAGKSSLISTIVGSQPPTRGQVRVLEQDPTSLKASQRRSIIGYVPQEPSDLLFHATVSAECAQADRDNKSQAGATARILERLVPNISMSAHPRDLSEGQRLALVLAIVISANPTLLILDEPTRGLDYHAKSLFSKILKEYILVGSRTILLATHDVELVAELADRTLFLADGEVVADGPTLEVLLSSPAFAPQVAKVMSPAPWLTVGDVMKVIEYNL